MGQNSGPESKKELDEFIRSYKREQRLFSTGGRAFGFGRALLAGVSFGFGIGLQMCLLLVLGSVLLTPWHVRLIPFYWEGAFSVATDTVIANIIVGVVLSPLYFWLCYLFPWLRGHAQALALALPLFILLPWATYIASGGTRVLWFGTDLLGVLHFITIAINIILWGFFLGRVADKQGVP